ncbi:hypothetical protein POM88_003373 [Heracleum sosnowskyi]|uniref:RIN4 pathogenic type III effector avirulence factor Avr cleavage site domain-containing protein n=1 Tax=Heracleum sosnowskyi TaxID=360622 RepID=A0AAD8JIJ0_9APIA|nr:hypothetical protein POM88_003373 [Heracleum sosnowskyi]
MEHRRQKHETWVSVPQFGGWDLRGVVPGYGAEFSEISETRKQNKRDATRASVGTEAGLSLYITSSKPNQAKPSGGVSSGLKSETANPKPRGGVSSPLNIEPTKARPSSTVSSRSKNKPRTTVSRQRSSSIFSYFNCCTKP